METKRYRIILLVLTVLSTALVLPNLGRNCLWEDEAQTAVIAQNILTFGVPKASDGTNTVSVLPDHRDIRDGIYIWQGWVPTYAAAASIAVFGRTSFGARLPFALAFVCLVGVYYSFLRKWHHPRYCQPMVAVVLLVACVPMLLHARQCRYYLLVPLLNLLVVDAYLSLLKESKFRHLTKLVVWVTLLVNSFFPGAFLLFAALVVDLIKRRPTRQQLKLFGTALGILVAVNLPMAVFCRVLDRKFGFQPGYSDWEVFGMYLLRYLLTLNNYVFPFSLILLAGLLRWRTLARGESFNGELSFLFLIICITQFVGFSILSDYPYTRYLIGMVPFFLFFGAGSIEVVSFKRRWLLWALVVVVLGTNLFQILPLPLLRRTRLQEAQWTTAGIEGKFLAGEDVGMSIARGEIKTLIGVSAGFPMADYLRSIINPPKGPIDCIVEYLQQNAAPLDRVKNILRRSATDVSYASRYHQLHGARTSGTAMDHREIFLPME